MKQLWSPWRSNYINSINDDEKKESTCFFCDAVASNKKDDSNLVVHYGKKCFIVMNKYPYNNGHLLIAPKRHISELTFLEDSELNELIYLQKVANKVLKELYNPDGFNIGANLGRSAGAGVPGHLHYHILPRWNGDTNFMPIISETKVISESLIESYHKITASFEDYLK